MSAAGVPNYLRMARSQGKIAGRIDSRLEAIFEQGLRADKVRPWKRNYPFLPPSKVELDFAWPDVMFGVEIDGSVHRIRERFHADYQKHGQALLARWVILRLDSELVRTGLGLAWTKQLLERCAAVDQ